MSADAASDLAAERKRIAPVLRAAAARLEEMLAGCEWPA